MTQKKVIDLMVESLKRSAETQPIEEIYYWGPDPAIFNIYRDEEDD